MKILQAAAAAALIATSASASAWWGNNGNFMDDFFGDAAGDFDFSFNMSARGNGYGRGYNDYRDYYGYGAPVYAAPVLTAEQQAAITEQQQAFAEQQQKAYEQAVAAQRQHAEQFNADPRTSMDTEFKSMQEAMETRRTQMLEEMKNSAPVERELPAHIAKRIEESQARRDAMTKEMDVRRTEVQKQMEAYRAASMERAPFDTSRKEI